MPIYEYQCPRCGAKVEMMQKFGDEYVPDCTSEECQQYADTTLGCKMIKVLSKSTFILKGGCWARDGYSKK